MKKCVTITAAAVLLFAIALKADNTTDGHAIYDSNPNHLWNRLNETLFERTAQDGKKYVLGELDILYWATTTNLLVGTSHQQAISVLDEFINSRGEKLIQNPLKKALLQRDLWALFDWTTEGMNWNYQTERKELLKRLAVTIKRLGLTTNEIASLPDNYAMAVENNLSNLPHGLFQTNGDWINVAANNVQRLVPMHDWGFGGRSVFMVLFHDAGGRQAGTNYLGQISSVKPMWTPSSRTFPPNEMDINPNFPQFPTNSQWALVRCMCVIDADGRMQPTHVIESIQLRTYLAFGPQTRLMVTNQNGSVVPATTPPETFNEFRMTRPMRGLITLAEDEHGFTSNNNFFSKGLDPFEYHSQRQTNDFIQPQSKILKTCIECHRGTGIYSVNSFTRAFSGERPAETTRMIEANLEREEEMTLALKRENVSWGLLQGLWMQTN